MTPNNLDDAINKVCKDILKMTPEEFFAELEKPVENGVGDLLINGGIDLRRYLKDSPL